jgi:cobalt-zinc-cadmium efflux system membrane fusion protein
MSNITMRQFLTLVVTALIFVGVGMTLKSAKDHDHEPNAHGAPEHSEGAAPAEFERGPHRGRMLRDGDLAL